MARTVSRYSSKAGRAGVQARGSAGAQTKKSDVSGDVPSVLAELLALGDAGWVVSCYQKLEPADRAGDKYRIKLKNRLRRAADRIAVLGFSHNEREAVTAVLDKVEQFFANARNLAGARGAAVFAGKGWFRAVRLPHVLRSRVMVDRTPVVSELVHLTETGSRVLVVLADRMSARLFAVNLDGVEEIEGLVSPEASRGKRFHSERDHAGIGEYRFHNRIREVKHRHLARVAEAAQRAWRARAFDGVVVGGIGVDADALMPHLATDLRDKVLGVLKLAPKTAKPAAIREQAMALWSEASEHHAADAVGELSGLLDSNWAVDGVGPTLAALARGQVRTLVVDQDIELPGFRLPKSGRLTTSPVGTNGEGEPQPVADLLDDAMEDALRQRARVAVVGGEAATHFDTLAAILRFRTGE